MLSDQRSKINDEFEKEVKVLEAKYSAKKQPLFETRKQIISGEVTEFAEYVPKFEETHTKLEKIVSGIVKTEEDADKTEEEKEPINVDHLKNVQGIPDFWSLAIKNNKMIMHTFKEADEKLIPHIKSLEAVRFDKPKALELKVQFTENEYFTNEELTLKLNYKGDTEEVVNTEGSSVNWKDGKNITTKKIKKKQKNKKTGETRTITKTVESDSFFNAFTSQKAPEEPEDDDEDSEAERAFDRFDEAVQIAEDFYDLFAQDALEYYLGLNDDEDFMGMGLGDSDDDDDEDDDEDSDKKKKTKAQAPQVGPDGKECKQQ